MVHQMSLVKGHANAKVYSDDPQGQVDALTDMYQTLLSNDNGLGAFTGKEHGFL